MVGSMMEEYIRQAAQSRNNLSLLKSFLQSEKQDAGHGHYYYDKPGSRSLLQKYC